MDAFRELFIEELEHVHGGGPVEDVLALLPSEVQPNPELGALKDLPLYTTLACGEEAGSGC